jgi:hypothetical protein
MIDPTIVLVFAVVGVWTCLGCVVLVLAGVLVRRHRRMRARQVESLLAHMARHPAGSRFAFRARPCGHKLYTSSLDVLDMEHLEFDHALSCPVTEQILSNERDAA